MFRRGRALEDPVTITLDGAAVPAERGEPLAVALIASGRVTLARSPKLHRPRAPSCLRGGCDGCLARVDGVPNVMTCLRPATGGERIESQNVVGSRQADLLRVTDWFFPQGIDHHHLMAGVPGLSGVVQSIARKLAGLGRLPSAALPVEPAARLDVDAAVIGAGPAGVAAASALAARGLRVALVDDGLAPAGSLAGAPRRAAALLERHRLDGVRVLSRHVAAGVYLGEILVAGDAGALVVHAPAKVFATGAHDGVVAVPNNDLPGVFSARALCRLLAHGVEPTGPVALAGEGFWADELAFALGDRLAARVPLAALVAVNGISQVKSVTVRDAPFTEGSEVRDLKVVAVAVDAPAAPSFEVAAQAGARVRYDPRAGYAVSVDARGRAGDGVWALGECTGAALDPAGIEHAAAAVADDVLAQRGAAV
ncbi:NADH dehydrogenase [Sorangium cellulosum]|uniref:NADH dehydrogenase n=1 Tax=Sorangium cellulosum TaxID=56 RepID=A0A2L0EPZ7_SORCE|nr:(2Fe-2S)-binding protein [Sorangium cellulosum]AUX41378.1 NADH dehydrogenase [Sorangium cellulosum]